MIALIDINETHRRFWAARHRTINGLSTKSHLMVIVMRRELHKAQFVKLAASEPARIERIRNQTSFECELENVAEEYASLPLMAAQRLRAKKPRGKLAVDGDRTLDQIIEALVCRPEHRNSSASEIWPFLFSELEYLRLDPKEIDSATYSYDFKDWPAPGLVDTRLR
jgi:hypothetical protein